MSSSLQFYQAYKGNDGSNGFIDVAFKDGGTGENVRVFSVDSSQGGTLVEPHAYDFSANNGGSKLFSAVDVQDVSLVTFDYYNTTPYYRLVLNYTMNHGKNLRDCSGLDGVRVFNNYTRDNPTGTDCPLSVDDVSFGLCENVPSVSQVISCAVLPPFGNAGTYADVSLNDTVPPNVNLFKVVNPENIKFGFDKKVYTDISKVHKSGNNTNFIGLYENNLNKSNFAIRLDNGVGQLNNSVTRITNIENTNTFDIKLSYNDVPNNFDRIYIFPDTSAIFSSGGNRNFGSAANDVSYQKVGAYYKPVYSTGVEYNDGMGRNQNSENSQIRAFNRRIWKTEQNTINGRFNKMTFNVAQNRDLKKTNKDFGAPSSSDFIRYKKIKALTTNSRRLRKNF